MLVRSSYTKHYMTSEVSAVMSYNCDAFRDRQHPSLIIALVWKELHEHLTDVSDATRQKQI